MEAAISSLAIRGRKDYEEKSFWTIILLFPATDALTHVEMRFFLQLSKKFIIRHISREYYTGRPPPEGEKSSRKNYFATTAHLFGEAY